VKLYTFAPTGSPDGGLYVLVDGVKVPVGAVVPPGPTFARWHAYDASDIYLGEAPTREGAADLIVRRLP